MNKSVEQKKDLKDSKHAALAPDAKTQKIQATKHASQDKDPHKFETPQKIKK